MKKTEDEFSGRTDISRQRKSQLRNLRDGKCVVCGQPSVTKQYCEKHRQMYNAAQRERKQAGCTWRYLGAKSYRYAPAPKKTGGRKS